MTIFEYYKQTNNKEIYNKTIAYNILQSINDLKFDNITDFKNCINTKLNSFNKLHNFCDLNKIKNYVMNNYKTFDGKILTSYKAVDEKIL